MAILKPKSGIGSANNILKMTDGAGLCCGDEPRKDYAIAETDVTGTTVADVGIQIPGGAVVSTDLDGAAIDWTDPANDATLIAALEKAATDAGYLAFDGGIELTRGATDNDLTVTIRDSSLIWAWIGTDTTAEVAFVATDVVP